MFQSYYCQKKKLQIHFQANLQKNMAQSWKWIQDIVAKRDGFFKDTAYRKMKDGLIFPLKVE